MRLLFDQQLSPKLVHGLADCFPGSAYVSDLGLGEASDHQIWVHARDHGLSIVTKDADYGDLVTMWGFPPRVIWIRLGNCNTAAIEQLLRKEHESIRLMHEDPTLGLVSLT